MKRSAHDKVHTAIRRLGCSPKGVCEPPRVGPQCVHWDAASSNCFLSPHEPRPALAVPRPNAKSSGTEEYACPTREEYSREFADLMSPKVIASETYRLEVPLHECEPGNW